MSRNRCMDKKIQGHVPSCHVAFGMCPVDVSPIDMCPVDMGPVDIYPMDMILWACTQWRCNRWVSTLLTCGLWACALLTFVVYVEQWPGLFCRPTLPTLPTRGACPQRLTFFCRKWPSHIDAALTVMTVMTRCQEYNLPLIGCHMPSAHELTYAS